MDFFALKPLRAPRMRSKETDFQANFAEKPSVTSVGTPWSDLNSTATSPP